MVCKSCGCQNDPTSAYCFRCGAKLEPPQKKSYALFLCIGAVALALIIIAVILLPRLIDGLGREEPPSETAPTIPATPAYAEKPVPEGTPMPELPAIEPAPMELTAQEFVGNVFLHQNIEIASAEASSQTETYDGSTFYNPENVFDGDTSTSWQEGVPGYGEGECLILRFRDEEEVEYISFIMGSNTLPGYFEANGKPKGLLFEFSDGSSFSYDFPLTQSRYNIRLNQAVTTSYLSVTIMSTFPGSDYEDTAISEISVFGP